MDLIVIASIAIQLAAAGLALFLIPETGRRWSWILIAAGLIGMVHRRVHTLYMFWQGRGILDLNFELIGLLVSVIILLGIVQIRPIFRQLKAANEKLARSEERFRTVADFTYDWEYWRGPDGGFLYMSPSCERITGYPRSAFVKDPDLMVRIVHPEDRPMVKAHLFREHRAEDTDTLDFRIIRPDGVQHWLSHRCVPVTNAQGTFLGARASNRIIDQRVEAENRLRESRRLYRDLVEQSHFIVLEVDTRGRIFFINRWGLQFYGFLEGELIGREAVGLLLPETDEEGVNLRSHFRDLLERNPGHTFTEVLVSRHNETKATLSLGTSVIVDELGKATGILCIGIDVTARRAAEKLKEDVERIVRHDLKSPLMGIIGLPRLMQEDENLTDRQKEMLVVVEEAGMQMMDLINQSLTLYKLESGTYEHQPRPVDWLAIIMRAVRDTTMHREPACPVEATMDGKPVDRDMHMVIQGDNTLLYGMTANLLKNAVEASGGRPVRVAVTGGDPCVLEIRNSLPVPEEVRHCFFDKYSTSGKHNGTGLGTYSARLAAEAHGGNIAMDTSSEGTVVRVTLPRGKAAS
ncbi:multi-sensor signal transduction histidine kinase [Pseudodesulfovibrio mercurii]|uniref:histidine kinase n=1 Tax=Pseudodesulfovibrio mercurii TaxID=641491 RepID=F0JIK1_9BACT|nr:PAS domain-containing sensor histidine kinase [Pseudodesulfovibrio mercurii]EGB15435.1 multi-sensor signal transduction histidine kinase [Pseudodesulfovibrio mercurii]